MKRVTSYLTLTLSVVMFFLWLIFRKFNLLVWSVFLLNIECILFSLINIKKRICYMFFNLTIFLFLLSRPVIDMLGKYDWINYDESTGTFTLIVIEISLIFLQIGMVLSEKYCLKKNINDKYKIYEYNETIFIKKLRNVSYILFIFCIIFSYLIGIEKLIFSQGRSYVDYYVEYSSNLPSIVKYISTMMPATFVIYLSTMPKKKEAFIPMMLYFMSAIPNLIIGSRAAISECAVFICLYAAMRDSIDKDKFKVDGIKRNKWISKTTKIFVICILPIVITFFSSYNYLRFDVKKTNNMNPIVDFMYSQGVSFTAVTRGYLSMEYISKDKNFTFGPLIDYIKTGTPAQILFGVDGIPTYNSAERVERGNNFSDSLSYYLYKPMYLSGRGTGSSYIIEVYTDYGLVGIIIFNLFLGMLLSMITSKLSDSWFKNIFLLRIIMEIFLMPRTSALGWLLFIVAPQFWTPILVCWVWSIILTKISKKQNEKILNIKYEI